ncbi:HD-GYP domain-containing protein [Paenibacillus cremeus]|uniref:HD-GYP domain-containing protein n=1 Tax=Paenibacillus cremeus TaxID=2163881 RepID=A0A559KEY5_9BACL|nr:HD-GYP domain-containing protein [Paenibacillus cremeus]TVY10686.1 HD-GYP domain-containing protein [Paenibacillus cremeus]
MTTVPVSQLKVGEKLSENVLTKYSNVLFSKGKLVMERDIEILKAFLIPSVQIETKSGEADTSVEEVQIEESNRSVLPFYENYSKLLQLLRKVFTATSSGGQNLPILEIRTTLADLIQHISHYNVLTFSPKNFQLSEFLYHNSIMVSLTSYNLARWHGYPTKDLMPIALGGLLHDIGNAKVDSSILFKPSRLSPVEVEDMKRHTIIGYNLLKSVPAINEGVKFCALQHHEREDGSGYPLGVGGDKVHPYSKIVAIADMFHAMTTDRFHKKGSSPYLVLEQLLNDSFGKMEPALVQTFIHKVTAFHNGTLVKLSDSRIGEIVFSDRSNPTRPWVNVNGKIVNLTLERSLYIQELIHKL